MKTKTLSKIKNLIIPKGQRPRKIPLGLYKGLKFNLDFTCQTQLFLGLSECETHSWLKKFSKGINSAIDIGAGDGEQTLYFLAKTDAKKVYSFEPSKERLTEYIQNITLNGYGKNPRFVFISKYVGSNNNGSTITLDSIVDSIILPCVIKIDTEGGEVDILRGAKRLLELQRIRWLIETHSYQLESECIKILDRARYITKIIPNAWWRTFIPEQRPTELNRWLIAYKDQI